MRPMHRRKRLTRARAHAGKHVRRCALVGNTRAIPEIGRFFASSVEVRHFADNEEAAAWDWVAAANRTKRD